MPPRFLVSLFALLLPGLTRGALAAAPVAAAPPAATFNVRDFGAKADGTTKDTAAFQKALDTCAVSGGGRVRVPAGHYLIGSIQLGYRTTLLLEAGSIITGSPDLADYPMIDVRWEGRWQPGRRGLIYAANVDHIGIVGPGRIEGTHTGTNAPDGTRNPVVLEPISCQDVRWEGFTVTQGGNWATHPTYCTDLVITGVNISGGRDGIDVDSCRHVRIEDSVIVTGDDSISLKSGRGMDGARLGLPCEDILITGCDLTDQRFACVGIGSEISGGVRQVRIEHCKLAAPRSFAIYLKTRIGRAGANSDITGEDLDLVAGSFLRINLTKGGNASTADDPVGGLVGYPSAQNLGFSHVRVKAQTLVEADEISALKPLRGLVLSDITGTCTQGITLANVTAAQLSGIAVTGFSGPLLRTAHVTGTGLEGAVAIPAPVDPPPGNARGNPRRQRPGPAPAT